MSIRILIAGGGHGGFAAAARLAKEGYSVTVFERNERNSMGHDWTDIFAPCALDAANLPMPEKDKYEYKNNMTFYSPDLQTPVMQHVPADQLEIKMERRDIYDLLIGQAEKNGAEIVFGCEVKQALMAGNRVVGIKTSQGNFFGDLIIDAAGLNSPLRKSLPPMCLIEKDVADFEQIYIYRAFYNKLCEGDEINKYKVFLLPQGKLGLGWVATEENHVDILIGRFKPFGMDEVESTLAYLREFNPELGDEVKRGGQFVSIPVRQPMSVLVCDGYAAIGDSAFMTVPIIGSGIANSLKASALLCDAIMADKAGAFSAESLWKYQRSFFSKLGSGLAPIACVKNLLTVLKAEEVDYLFANSVLTADDLTIGADSTSLLSMLKGFASPAALIEKVSAVIKDKELLKKIVALIGNVVTCVSITAAMPASYNTVKVKRWSENYLKAFRKLTK